MRLIKRFAVMPLCLVLAACLVLAGCAPKGLVVGKVDNEAITADDVNLIVDYILMQNGQSRADVTDADTLKSLNQNALESAVVLKLTLKKATEMKLYPLSQEHQKEVDDIVSQSASSLPAGMTAEKLKKLETEIKACELVADEINKGVTVTDADVKAEYDSQVEAQKTSFSADASAYENALAEGSAIIVYKPEGYRYVKHILIMMPEDIATQITEAQTSGDTQTIAKLRDEGLPKIKAKADEVLAKVKAGGDFDALMAQYGKDPGMQEEPTSKTGYAVGSSSSFVKEFLQAAMGLKNIGDTTDLVATDFGYHIIKWVGNVPSGPVKFEDVKEDISAQMLQTKQDEAWNTAYKQWEAAAKIEKYPEKIPVVTPAVTGTLAPASTAK